MRTTITTMVMLATLSGFCQTNDNALPKITTPTEGDSVAVERFLNEITVYAKRPNNRLTKGGILSLVAGTPLSDAGTCHDVLLQMPGVRGDDGKIEVIGKGAPRIYINGRIVTDQEELQRLASQDVQSVEVIGNPGAKYGADVKSVIKIRTIRQRGDGLSGSAQGSLRLARFVSQSEDAMLNYRRRGTDLFGGINFDYSQMYQKQRNEETVLAGTDIYTMDSRLRIYPKGRTYTVNAGVNHEFNRNHYAGVRYECGITPYSESKWKYNEKTEINGVSESNATRLVEWDRSSRPKHSLNVYYDGKIKALTINLTNDLYYRNHNEEQRMSESSALWGERRMVNHSSGDDMMVASRGSVAYTRERYEIEAGYEITNTRRHSVFRSGMEELHDADDLIKELTAAEFVESTVAYGNVEVGSGVRFEHTTSNYYENGIRQPAQSRNYSRLYPNVDVTFPIGKAKFTISYTSKIKRPLYSQLGTSIQYDDRFTYETGNPHLRPENIHDVSVAGIYKWIFFSADYQRVNDAIIGVTEEFENGNPASLMSYVNKHHIIKYSAVVSLSPRFGKWSPRLRLNLLGQDFRTETIDGDRKMNRPLLFWSLYNTFGLPWGLRLSADVTGRLRGDMDIVTLKSSWQLNMGLSKSIDNWYFQIQVTDIWGTARNSMITYGSKMTLDKWNYSDTRGTRIMVRYSFNTVGSKYKGKSAGMSERQRL